ncbi:RWD domain containing protein, putative [Babesia bigemina]|uniref:RWD domain containing protein, putative n=1 Tax=Babesia bigemina TaxID=5866 RepID=A0A061D3E6_BABBI|nr:RWD domain containing protein, putative [Babesia bigemina]CDR95251.1 RWD domain containing protein, putative [Babesia bigemina]|eukprot:XP_012767437.1 RWD domain containing protein, putative [Babesia bigemina]
MDESERAMEIEALSAIFIEGEELQIISENEVVITCDPRSQDGSHGCSMKLKFVLPEGYPAEESPSYEIVDELGITYEDKERILAVIEEVIEQNRGMPMLYPIVEAVNEQLATCATNAENGESESDNVDGEVEDGENGDETNQRDGMDTGLFLKQLCNEQDRVTKEIFDEWSKTFRLNMIKKGIWRDIDAGRNKGQMTGREIFESKSVVIDVDGMVHIQNCHWRSENENVFWNDEALYEGDCDEDALE